MTSCRLWWFLSRRRWKRWMRALRGNTAAQLRVWCWNARQLAARADAAESSQSALKKAYIFDCLGGEGRPDLLFVCEVNGTLRDLTRMRGEARQLGYEMPFMIGSRRNGDTSAKPYFVNSIVAFTRRGAGRVVRHDEAELRCWAVRFRPTKTARSVVMVCLHGIHGARDSDEWCAAKSSFVTQADAAANVVAAGGGLLLGDFNFVPCASWRTGQGEAAASGYNKVHMERVQGLFGWACACCTPNRPPSGGHVVGPWRQEDGTVIWTRREATAAGWQYARIDGAAAYGREEPLWSMEQPLWPADEREGFPRLDLSDHAVIRMVRTAPLTCGGEWRPTAVKLGERGGAISDAYEVATARRGLKVAVQLAQEECLADGGAEVDALVSQLRAAAEAAVLEDAERRGGVSDGDGQGTSARCEHNSWLARLNAARTFAKAGADPREVACPLLFHRATGLRKCVVDDAATSWRHIVARCRRQVCRAGSIMRKRLCADDRRLLAQADRLLDMGGEDMAARARAVWALLRDRRAPVHMDKLFPFDNESLPPVKADEDAFLATGAQIGQQIVEGLDCGAVAAALEGWCQVFAIEFAEIKGIDGGDWLLCKELTFPLFRKVVRRMPRNKSVGAGGFSIELLQRASPSVLWTFYEAMMRDLERGVVSNRWRKVLYALLVKPPPSKPYLVKDRREIALMAQDMKLCLHMVRATAYESIQSRVASDQLGWVAGYGTGDVGLSLAALLAQGQRMETLMYILYMDLATFFPKINRKIGTVAELLQGLPPEALRLTLLIYGGYNDRERAVECQYDTAAGLSAPFKNWMGWLMGCVLSPDKAKILLNTSLLALRIVIAGVPLFGFGREEGPSAAEAATAWECIQQLVYGDDWAGACMNLAEVVKAWEMWVAWTEIVGARIGVKLKLKTVLAGVDWVGGKPVRPRDPELRLRDGGVVEMLDPWEAYKHIGIWRSLDGTDTIGRSKLCAGLRGRAFLRLRRIRRGSMSRAEFGRCSDALIGGVVMHSCQSMAVSFQLADKLEAEWRTIFSRAFRRPIGAPAAELYLDDARSGAPMRTHIWTLGLACIYTSVNRAMADVHATPQRSAARSGVALAMRHWGCRTDPNLWRLDHLQPHLERELTAGKVHNIFDAYLLACILLEGAVRDDESRVALEELRIGDRVRGLGRWEIAVPFAPGDPLRTEALHFKPPESMLLFQPSEDGGLGIEPAPALIHCGIVAIGHVCKPPRRGRQEAGAFCSADELCARHGWRLSGVVARRAAEEVLEWLSSRDVPPAAPEVAQHAAEVWKVAGSAAAAADRHAAAAGGKVVVDIAALRALGATAAAERAGPAEAQRSKQEWQADVAAAVRVPVAPVHQEWTTGASTAAMRARGARVFAVLDAERSVVEEGGEATFLCRGEAGGERRVGADGYLEGWEAEYAELRSRVAFDANGMPVGADGVLLAEADLGELPPALRLQCWARLKIGDVEVKERSVGKVDHTHVSLDVQRNNHEELCCWQARVGVTHAFCTDSSFQKKKDTDGRPLTGEYGPEVVTTVGVGFDDGSVTCGLFEEAEGSNNYLGELGSLVVALQAMPNGARPLAVIDATSPVSAWLRFRCVHHRWRQCYYASALLDELDRQVGRLEALVVLWQTSHVGSPANEWADCIADAGIAKARVAVGRGGLRFCSMRPRLPQRGWFRWACTRARRVVFARLSARSPHAVLVEPGDMEIGPFEPEASRLMAAVRCNAVLVADRVSKLPAPLAAVLRGAPCSCGARRADGAVVRPTWTHKVFWCQDEGCVEGRKVFTEKLTAAATLISGGKSTESNQVSEMLWVLERNMFFRVGSDGEFMADSARARVTRRHAQRFLGGYVEGGGGGAAGCGRSEVVRGVRHAVLAGLEILQGAEEGEAQLAAEVLQKLRDMAVLRRVLRPWAQYVVQSGPARVAALAEVRRERLRVGEIVRMAAAEGAITGVGAYAARRRLRSSVVAAISQVHACVPRETLRYAALWCVARAVRVWAWRRQAREESRRRIHRIRVWPLSASLRGFVQVAMPAYEVRGEWQVRVKSCAGAVGWEVGVREWALRAARKCARLRAGWKLGRKQMAALAAEGAAVRRARQLRLQQVAMRSWRATGSLSGMPLLTYGNPISIVLAGRKRARGIRMPSMEERDATAGLGADGAGRWAAAGVVEARRAGSGRVEGLVTWRGRDKVSGDAWPRSWVSLRDMSSGLRAETRALLPVVVRRLPKVLPARAGRGSRTSGRLALLGCSADRAETLRCSVGGVAGELRVSGGVLAWSVVGDAACAWQCRVAEVRFADAELRVRGRGSECVLRVGAVGAVVWEAVVECAVGTAQGFAAGVMAAARCGAPSEEEEDSVEGDGTRSEEAPENADVRTADGGAVVADAAGRVVVSGEEWYRVLRVLRVRGSGSREEAWVEWAGRAAADGATYECSWVPVRQLSADMQTAARALRKRRAVQPAATAVGAAVARRAERAVAAAGNKRAANAAAARAAVVEQERAARVLFRGVKRAADLAPQAEEAASAVAAKRGRGRRAQPDVAGRKRWVGALPSGDAEVVGERRRARVEAVGEQRVPHAGGARVESGQVTADGVHDEIFKHNSRVYAARTDGGMGGLFALVDAKRGDILVEYTGKLITLKAAKASSSEYLIDARKVVKRGSTRTNNTVIDGAGELGGFANYACSTCANVVARDMVEDMLRGGRRPRGDTAVVLIARCDIAAGQELRFDYDTARGGAEGSFRAVLVARGVAEATLDSDAYLQRRWSCTTAATADGLARREEDFMFDSLTAAGLDMEKAIGDGGQVTDG